LSNEQSVEEQRIAALCEVLDDVTQKTLGKQLAGKPSYEVVWLEKMQEKSWVPALSLIPMKRMHSFGFNVRALQLLFFKDSEEPVYVMYGCFTPRDGLVIVASIEVGVLLDFTVPRGLIMKKDELSLLRNRGESSQSTTNPLDAVIRREMEHKKKSKLMQSFKGLDTDIGFEDVDTKVDRYLVIAPRNNRTLVAVSSSARPPKQVKKTILYPEGNWPRKKGCYFWMPNNETLADAIALLGHAANRASTVRCDYPVTSLLPEVQGLLPVYLALEAGRMELMPEDDSLSLDEMMGRQHSERVSSIKESIPERMGTSSEIDSEKEASIRVMCPHCKGIYALAPSQIPTDGKIQCQKCSQPFDIKAATF